MSHYYPAQQCPSCEKVFRPFYAEQIYCSECRAESIYEEQE